jgi:NitT/TauT family transport system substrate-binding protein
MRPWNLPALSAGIAAAAATALLAACGTSSGSPSDGKATEVWLGYFPNITHATALVGVEEGLFAKHLGPDITLKTTTFNAGPSAIEAIFSGAIDATYVGPNPAINGWAQSKGKAINVIAGAASGGAFLVVKPQINGVEDLKGKKVGTPQLGNTQDVALRYWLAEHGLEADTKGGGEVSVVPQENSQNLQTFITGDIDGAWLPEPWASRFIQEGGGKVFGPPR